MPINQLRADKFRSNFFYTIGDVVEHKGNEFKCNTDHRAKFFNSPYWTPVDVTVEDQKIVHPVGLSVQVVNSEADFPPAVNGVITLDPSVDGKVCYLIGNSVVLNNVLKIAPGQLVAMIGYDSACSIITTLSLTQPTIDITGATLTTQWLTWNNLGTQPIFYAEEDTNGLGCAIYAHRLVINNCSVVTHVTDSRNMGFTECRIIQTSSGCFSYFGDQGGVQTQDVLVDGTAVGPFLNLNNSVATTAITIDTVFLEPEFTGDFIVGLANNGNLAPNTFATVSGCNIKTSGAGLTGVTRDDTRWTFIGNDGIDDSHIEGTLSVENNTNSTTFTGIGDTKILNAVYTIKNTSQILGSTSGTMTIQGEISRAGVASVNLVLFKPSAGESNYTVGIYDNGVAVAKLTGIGLRQESSSVTLTTNINKENGHVFDVRITPEDGNDSVIARSIIFSIR